MKHIMGFSSMGTPENPDNHPVLAKHSKRLTNLMHYIHDPSMWIFSFWHLSVTSVSAVVTQRKWWACYCPPKGPGPCQGQTEVKPGSADGKCKPKHSIHSAVNTSPTAYQVFSLICYTYCQQLPLPFICLQAFSSPSCWCGALSVVVKLWFRLLLIRMAECVFVAGNSPINVEVLGSSVPSDRAAVHCLTYC